MFDCNTIKQCTLQQIISVAYHWACIFTTEETDKPMLKEIENIPTHTKLESGGERKREWMRLFV